MSQATRKLWASSQRVAKTSTSVLGTDRQAEVTLHAPVPGFVVGGMQGQPFFVGHRPTPVTKGRRIRSDRVPQLPSSALDDLADLLCHQGRRRWVLERCSKQMGK